MRLVLSFLLLLASSATAQNACDDVWFTRNLLFDRAGYCFGSTLGQALFDNGDCIGKNVTLDPTGKRLVDEIRRLEAQHSCNVDTARTTLAITDIAIRRNLRDLPLRDEFESGCLGWLGDTAPLRAGYDERAAIIGRIEPGDDVLFSFLPQEGWSYVTTHGRNFSGLKAGGWVPNGLFPEEACAAWAG